MSPRVISLSLPWPPSLNKIWRSKGKKWKGKGKPVFLHPEYVAWKEHAGWIIKAGKHQQIQGEFAATIILNPPDKRKSDIDNRIKPLLDLAEKTGLIVNDVDCRLLIISYGAGENTPPGVQMTLTTMGSVSREAFPTTSSGLDKQ